MEFLNPYVSTTTSNQRLSHNATPFENFPLQREMEKYADSTRALSIYIYIRSIGFVNGIRQKRGRVKRSILHGLLKGCDGPEAAGAGGAWLRFRLGESHGRRRRRRWGGAAPLPPSVQPTVPQSRAEPAGRPSASA